MANNMGLLVAPDALARPGAPRRTVIIVSGVLLGLAVAVLWSPNLVDDQIGDNTATALLGHDAGKTALTGGLAGAVFAFVAGLAGTFTACNVAAFSAMGPMMRSDASAGGRARAAWQQVLWLGVGLVAISAVYGAVGAAAGTGIPQLSSATVGNHVPVRLVQSLVVFVVIGIAFVWLGLAAIDVVPDPLRRLSVRFPHAPSLVMGVLIGGFLIGRPYPLFFKLFRYAAQTHNPFYGALTFVLTAIGNVLLVAVLFLALTTGPGLRVRRWLVARPGRLATLTASALLIGGTFLIVYWGLRLPAYFHYGWFPKMPWK